MNFENAKFIRSLMWFEGTLLDLSEMNDKLYLCKWADVVEEEARTYNVWLIIEVEPEILDLYLNKLITMRDVEERSPAVFVQESSHEAEAAYTEYDDIPDDWKAPSTSFYDETLQYGY